MKYLFLTILSVVYLGTYVQFTEGNIVLGGTAIPK